MLLINNQNETQLQQFILTNRNNNVSNRQHFYFIYFYFFIIKNKPKLILSENVFVRLRRLYMVVISFLTFI